MAYDPKDLEGLTTITGGSDPNAQKFREIDPIGAGVFGWGNTAWNNEIQRKNAKLMALKAQIGEERFNTIKQAVDANGGDWSQLGIDINGEDGNKLDQQYGAIEGSDQGSLKDLLGSLGNYQNSADFFKDPNFMGDVGDIQGYQGPSTATLGAQKDALQQFKNLSSPTETAQEKLIRMMANRDMEAHLAGDRDALAHSLKARGVYGSGDELVGNMMSQGQAADRAALSNATANAQASQRAMSALGSYSDLAGSMRGQEMNEGSLAQDAAKFNNSANQAQVNARAGAQVGATQQGQTDLANRASTGFKGSMDVNNAVRSDIPAVNTAKTNYVTGNTANTTAGANLMTGAYDKQVADVDQGIALNDAKKRTSWL